MIAHLSIGIDGMAGASVFEMLGGIDRSRRDLALTHIEKLRAEPGAPLRWQEAHGVEPIRSLAQRALYADLLVLGQHDPSIEDFGISADFVESVVIQSGCPALVIPYIGAQQTLAKRVLVAWKETASTARALRAALPLLAQAEEVHVVSWGEEEDAGAGPDAVTVFLRQHGIESRLKGSARQPGQVGERLLSMAADVSADLLVMGCYGHSRARELVLGGATRSILASMTLPVLMAH
jgi:nucleotide-binding universal stress UspA family protein